MNFLVKRVMSFVQAASRGLAPQGPESFSPSAASRRLPLLGLVRPSEGFLACYRGSLACYRPSAASRVGFSAAAAGTPGRLVVVFPWYRATFLRDFSRKGEYPKNQRLSRKRKYLKKKFEGLPLKCYTCRPPVKFDTPKAFSDHNKFAHPDSKHFCGCKSGFERLDELHDHQEFDGCEFIKGKGE